MKKLTRNRVTAAGIIAGAMVASSGMMLSGCAKQNVPESVYGPPEMFSVETQTPKPAVTQSVQFSSEENLPEAVYGPPEDLGFGIQVTPDTSEDPYSPGNNQIEDVYGPPQDFDMEENIPETVYGPPEDLGYDEDGFYGYPDEYENVSESPEDVIDPSEETVSD